MIYIQRSASAIEKFELVEENTFKKQAEIQKGNPEVQQIRHKTQSQLATFMLQDKIISQQDFDRLTSAQEKQNRLMPQIVTELGLANPESIMKTFMARLKLSQVDPGQFSIPPAIAELVPRAFCLREYAGSSQKKQQAAYRRHAGPQRLPQGR